MSRKIEIINNWNLQNIFNELEAGNLKIPKFQRGYVWERSKIVKLLNSIYSQYPIGAFFIWNADKSYKHFCREIEDLDFPQNPNANFYSFILDGQQRITSLYVALRGKKLGRVDYSSICFNLDKKQFQIPRLTNEKHNIPAWKIFNTTEYGDDLTQYAIYDKENGTSYMHVWRECQQIFSDYPVCLIKSLEANLEEAITIFERINQGGKRLSLFDLVHASCWSTNFDMRESIKKFIGGKSMKSYGWIENEVFVQSLALNLHEDCTHAAQLKLTSIDCETYWNKTIKCIELALDFMRSFGVRNSSYVPYWAQIPIIQYYFFKSDLDSVKPDHFSLIERWFWTTIFSFRYSASSLTKMNEDARWISQLTKGNIEENFFPISLSSKELVKIRMNTSSVVKQGILCLMALKNPVDFDNGILVNLDKTEISRKNSKENHHLFPFALRTKFGVNSEIHCVLNFALIRSQLNNEIRAKFPADYLKIYSSTNQKIKEHLLTHFIDEACIRFMEQNDYKGFLHQRAENVLTEIRQKLKTIIIADDSNEIIESNVESDVDDEEMIEQEETNMKHELT